ncbi:MAG: response regulator transcription factor [Actinomycetota bacterium]|nr:response regulator transcription factor [Actinomycetota bacterium]
MAIRVVIAEDNYLVQQGIERLFSGCHEVEVVGVCRTYGELISMVENEKPDAVLTDIRMPPTGTDEGIRAALEIRASHPSTGVVVLSQYASAAYTMALLSGGTAGLAYLLKDRVSDLGQLLGAIRAVAAGGSVVDPKVVEELVAARQTSSRSPLSELTPRELEILGEMAQGKSNAAIAAAVYLNDRSVEKHINAIFTKLGLVDEPDVNRRVKAVVVFLSSGG